jgi:NADH-quinone oxidoreductase subunit I
LTATTTAWSAASAASSAPASAPPSASTSGGADNSPDAPVSPGDRYGYVYEINDLRCIHCDLCVEAGPTEAIVETRMFELSWTRRDDAIYTKGQLIVDDRRRPRHQLNEDWRSDDEHHIGEWVRATGPNGRPFSDE